MIEITSSVQLSLLFPHANKAMSKILEQASPEQLKTLSEAKDIKSILNTLMSDTLDTNKSNKIILDILKNSSFFKELGSFPKEMQALLELLKQEENPNKKTDEIIRLLKESLLDISDTKNRSLQAFIKNSGIFLESKFVQKNDPAQILKTALDELQNLLKTSDIKQAPTIIKAIQDLIKNETIFSKARDTTSLNLIKNSVEPIISSLKELINQSDPLHTKEIQKLVSTLETLSKNSLTKEQNFSLSAIKNSVHELSSELRVSNNKQTKELVLSLDKIQTKIEGIEKLNPTLSLLKSLNTQLTSLNLKDLSSTVIKELTLSTQEVATLSKMKFEEIELLRFDEVKSFFSGLSENISSIKSISTKGILELIEKILASLKQPHAVFHEQKLTKEITAWLTDFNKELAKGDIMYSKSLQSHLDKIETFTKPAHLLDNKLLQESLQKDVKALLLSLEKELTNNPLPNNVELLKTVDKLLVQVDYFQLLSHLSNASVLYLPYTWDGLDNGSFSFKNKKDGSCYCEIDLELKEYGKLNMMLQLFEDNQLNMKIYTQKKSLQEIFKTHTKELRSALLNINITPRNIHLFDLDEDNKKSHPYLQGEKLNELGFEVKG